MVWIKGDKQESLKVKWQLMIFKSGNLVGGKCFLIFLQLGRDWKMKRIVTKCINHHQRDSFTAYWAQESAWNRSLNFILYCFKSFSPLSNDCTEGVIMTRSNRMKFRLLEPHSRHIFHFLSFSVYPRTFSRTTKCWINSARSEDTLPA